jgi:hypothetical protein
MYEDIASADDNHSMTGERESWPCAHPAFYELGMGLLQGGLQ